MNALKAVLEQYKDRTPVLVMHAGSANHGCEAIVQSLLDLLEKTAAKDVLPVLVTSNADEDLRYALRTRIENRRLVLIEERHIERHFFYHVAYYAYRLLTKDEESFLRFRFAPLFQYLRTAGIAPKDAILYCIGGDNYCYPEMVKDLILANRVFHKKGLETLLLGCSVEPDSIRPDAEKDGEDARRALLEDLASYRQIVARESLTYEALQTAGMEKENLFLAPDPAFSLTTGVPPLPEGFVQKRTVGINLSPMVQALEQGEGTLLAAYTALIRHILQTSNALIALIPHVVWERNDDRVPLRELYRHFADTGRVLLVEDKPAQDLKYIISQCSLFIGARTHATIAAYSSGVPTLVLGYSVKSRGIAKDLFSGTKVETMTQSLPAPFVLPVQRLQDEKELIDAYDTLLRNAAAVQEVLRERASSLTKGETQHG